MSTGWYHSRGETTDNRAYCWGYDYYGQLGDGTTSVLHTTPVAVAGGLLFRQVSAGGWHTCGKTSAGVAYCWGGINGEGALGNGTSDNSSTPVRVAGAM